MFNPKKNILLTDEEDIMKENEVVDNHNEDLDVDDNDYYSFWEDTNENDD